MHVTLAKKFVLISLCFFTVSFLTIILGSSYALRYHMITTRTHMMSLLCDEIHEQLLESPDSFLDSSATSDEPSSELASLSHTALFRATCLLDEYTIWILNLDGLVLFSTDQTRGKTVLFNPLVKGTYYKNTYSDYFNEDTLTVYKSILPPGSLKPSGYILVHYPYAGILQKIHLASSRFFLLWSILVILWCICSVLLYHVSRKPIQKMISDARSFALEQSKGDFPIPTIDEFDALSEFLEQAFSKLRSVNENERQLLANISHDMRSPLTSIKGYLEAIQDGTIPYELQGRYIDIVLSETQRLTNLTQNLLLLHSLDSHREELECTTFDINSVIRQILLTFEQRCQKKELQFHLTIPNEAQIVYADLQKIQQVLYNLIDNALKFSPPHETIDISASKEYGKVFISILDHGPGISKEDIPKIWDRFYKTDPSRGLDKKGTGLGLSIVREIIHLHQETIYVNSTPGYGCEFIFSLPLADQSL